MPQLVTWPSLVLLFGATLCGATLTAQRPKPAPTDRTLVVMLGTGNPAIDPDRSGPATAIVVKDTAYLVDFGAGVVRRAQEAVLTREIKALDPTRLRVVFATHLHSDHTVGYPDLILTPWVMGRRVPLDVYGPKGIEAMTRHILDAYRIDTEARTGDEGMKGYAAPDAGRVNTHEVEAGVVYKDANVTVTAFRTQHAIESYGYRFETADRRVVMAGDTNPTQATIDACNGCDVLIHEAISPAWIAATTPARREAFEKFSAKFHTTTTQLAELAAKAKPKLLVLYHHSGNTPEELNAEMRAVYLGHFIVSRDLDVY